MVGDARDAVGRALERPAFHRAWADPRQAPSAAPSSCNRPSPRIRRGRDPGSADYRRRARGAFAPSRQFPRPWRREPRRAQRLFHRGATCPAVVVKALPAGPLPPGCLPKPRFRLLSMPIHAASRAIFVAFLALLFVFSTNRCAIAAAFPGEVEECCPNEKSSGDSERGLPCGGKDCAPCATLESGRASRLARSADDPCAGVDGRLTNLPS